MFISSIANIQRRLTQTAVSAVLLFQFNKVAADTNCGMGEGNGLQDCMARWVGVGLWSVVTVLCIVGCIIKCCESDNTPERLLPTPAENPTSETTRQAYTPPSVSIIQHSFDVISSNNQTDVAAPMLRQ